MTDSDYRMAAKRWRRRNSDGRDTFEGEHTQFPPAFTLDEYPLPKPDSERPTDRLDPEGVAVRHTHVWDPNLAEPA